MPPEKKEKPVEKSHANLNELFEDIQNGNVEPGEFEKAVQNVRERTIPPTRLVKQPPPLAGYDRFDPNDS